MTYDEWKLRAPEDDACEYLERDDSDEANLCEPCRLDDHHECAERFCDVGVCECLCREGWVKEKFGWHRPIAKKGQSE